METTAHPVRPSRIRWKSCQWKDNPFPGLTFLALVMDKITKGLAKPFINTHDLKIVLIIKIKQPALSFNFPITVTD